MLVLQQILAYDFFKKTTLAHLFFYVRERRFKSQKSKGITLVNPGTIAAVGKLEAVGKMPTCNLPQMELHLAKRSLKKVFIKPLLHLLFKSGVNKVSYLFGVFGPGFSQACRKHTLNQLAIKAAHVIQILPQPRINQSPLQGRAFCSQKIMRKDATRKGGHRICTVTEHPHCQHSGRPVILFWRRSLDTHRAWFTPQWLRLYGGIDLKRLKTAQVIIIKKFKCFGSGEIPVQKYV